MSPPPKRVPLKYENTPPPSPEAELEAEPEDSDTEEVKPKEIDLEGINDEIVEAVIIQLQKTGNRPHLVKELAAILSLNVKIVEQ
jgi:tRNA(Glu) U13 pseudouridine synthase TruD